MNYKIKTTIYSISKIIGISIILLTLSSCGFCNILAKQYYRNDEGGLRPGKNKFYLGKVPYVLKEKDLIKINCVYQLCYVWDKDVQQRLEADCNDPDVSISFIRFFENGRFFISRLDNEKNSLEQYNDLNSGDVGYYKIENNQLFLEYFDVNFGGMASDCGKYYRDRYEISENGIKPLSERRSENGIFFGWQDIDNSYWYAKKEIEGLDGIPDW